MTKLDIAALLTAAAAKGRLRSGASNIFRNRGSADHIGGIISATGLPQLAGKTVILLTIRLDNSGSMAGNEETVITACNHAMESFRRKIEEKGDQAKNVVVLVSIIGFWGVIYRPYTSLNEIRDLGHDEYVAGTDTPLYLETINTAAAVVAQSQLCWDMGAADVRSASLVVSDGKDESDGPKVSSEEVAAVINGVAPPTAASPRHLFAALGLGKSPDFFVPIFQSMGVAEKWIVTVRDIHKLTAVLDEIVAIAMALALAPPGSTSSVLKIGFQGGDKK